MSSDDESYQRGSKFYYPEEENIFQDKEDQAEGGIQNLGCSLSQYRPSGW